MKIRSKRLIQLLGILVVIISTSISTRVFASTVNDCIINNKISPAKETLALGRIYNQDPNRNGGINMNFEGNRPQMVVIHDVGVDGGNINGSIDYMVRTQDNAFVHAFVDDSQLITIADTSKKSWGSGSYGNKYGIQIEQMRVSTKDKFYRQIATLAKWTADQLDKYNMGTAKLMSSPSTPQKNDLSIKPDGNLTSYKMLAYKFNQTTDHVDPDAYWGRFGYDMNQFRDLVDYYSFNLGGMVWQNVSSDNSRADIGVSYKSSSKVRFTWQYYDISKKIWVSIAKNTPSNWITFKAPHPGQYLVHVSAQNSTGRIKEYSIGWNVSNPVPFKFTGMTWQKLSEEGGKVNFGVGYQSSSTVKFDWKYYDISKKTWTDMSSNTSSNWVTFNAPHAGQYLIYVKGRDELGKTQEYSIGWNVDERVSLTAMTWQKVSADKSKADIGVACETNTPVTYTWQYYDIDKKTWVSIASQTASNWVSIKLPHPGQYLIYVEAKTAGGKTTNYTIGWTVDELVELTGMTWQNTSVDKSVTSIGVAYNSNTNLTYTWQYYDIAKQSWVCIAANTPSNWVTVKLPNAGQYLIYVEARTPRGKTATYVIGWQVSFNIPGANRTQKAWFDGLYPDAQKLAGQNDLFPSVMLSQAIAESAWGQSELARNGNNLFGVKADASWHGAVISQLTSENTTRPNQTVTGYRTQADAKSGRPATTFVIEKVQTKYYVYANFRKYTSQAESLQDYVTKIKTTKNGSVYRYQNAWRSRAGTYQNAAQALQSGGYATDPSYAANLINRINNYKLYLLD